MNILGFNISRSKGLKSIEAKNTTTSGKLIQADKDIIMKIVNGFKDQSRKDIDKWRTAIKLTLLPDKPRYDMYYDLVDDLSTDGHLQAQIRLRKYAILNTDFSIIDKTSNKSNEEATEFFNQKWFYDFLNAALEASFKGTTLVEFKAFFQNKIEIAVIPHRNVVPQLKIIIPDLTKQQVINYNDDYFKDWLIEIPSNKPLGLLNDIIPNIIWKRNVAQSWMEFCEKFGNPLLTASTNRTDTKDIDKIEFMLKQLGEAAVGVFPQGTTVDIKEASRTDAYQTYSNFIAFNREEISVAVVGGTMLTNDGSSRSQSEVHERNLDDKIAVAEKRSLTFLVNDVLIPLLKNQGYTFIKDNDKFTFNKSHNLELDKYWNITQGILQEYELDDIEWLRNTFHVPVKSKKKITKTSNQFTALQVSEPNYTHCCGNFNPVASDFFTRIQNIQDNITKAIFENKNHLGASAELIAEESNILIEALINNFQAGQLKVDWNATDHLVLQAMEMNIIEFAQSKTEARLAAMNDLIINRDKNKIREFSQFKAAVDTITKNYNNSYLQTEYNNVIATAQNSAAFLRFKREAETVTDLLIYQTVGDSKVREEHQLLNGKVFSINDGEAMKLFPPNGHNDRCEMLQYVGDRSKVVQGKTVMQTMSDAFKQSEWAVNRAATKEIFSKKQFYTDHGEILTKINDINYFDYNGTQAINKMKGLAKITLDSSITPLNIAELFTETGKQNGTSFMGFEDYLNRKLILKQKVFNTHTQGKYLKKNENRHQLFPFVKEVLKNPDELWLNSISTKKFQARYIKFYKGITLIVETVLGTNNNEITTWYPLKANEIDKRKGLLLKKRKI